MFGSNVDNTWFVVHSIQLTLMNSQTVLVELGQFVTAGPNTATWAHSASEPVTSHKYSTQCTLYGNWTHGLLNCHYTSIIIGYWLYLINTIFWQLFIQNILYTVSVLFKDTLICGGCDWIDNCGRTSVPPELQTALKVSAETTWVFYGFFAFKVQCCKQWQQRRSRWYVVLCVYQRLSPQRNLYLEAGQ